jgi:hypothetical protein
MLRSDVKRFAWSTAVTQFPINCATSEIEAVFQQ